MICPLGWCTVRFAAQLFLPCMFGGLQQKLSKQTLNRVSTYGKMVPTKRESIQFRMKLLTWSVFFQLLVQVCGNESHTQKQRKKRTPMYSMLEGCLATFVSLALIAKRKQNARANSLSLWMWMGSLPAPSPPSLVALI